MFCIFPDSLEYLRLECSLPLFHIRRLHGFGAAQCHFWFNGTRSSNPDIPAAVVMELLLEVEVQHTSFSSHDLQMTGKPHPAILHAASSWPGPVQSSDSSCWKLFFFLSSGDLPRMVFAASFRFYAATSVARRSNRDFLQASH